MFEALLLVPTGLESRVESSLCNLIHSFGEERYRGTNLKIPMLVGYKLLLSPVLGIDTEKIILMDFGLRGCYNNIAGLRVIIYFVITPIIIIVRLFRKD